jgi:hypothetical protein
MNLVSLSSNSSPCLAQKFFDSLNLEGMGSPINNLTANSFSMGPSIPIHLEGIIHAHSYSAFIS